MKGLVAVGVGCLLLLDGCSSNCRDVAEPSVVAYPTFVFARNGRVTAGWTDGRSRSRAMTVNAESIPGTEWSLPFAHVVAGAAGDRSACVLERGTGTPEPRRAALITDDGVLELTIDAPVWDADIVFDGTKYQVLWIDTDTLHNISIDEDGVIGDDPTSALFDG